MCYSGKCKYENHMGECNYYTQINEYPFDALCVLNEALIYEKECENDLQYIIARTIIEEELKDELKDFIGEVLSDELIVKINTKIFNSLSKEGVK